MTARSEWQILAEYPDLLGYEDDRDEVRVVQLLDAGYRLRRAPAELRARVPRRLPGSGWGDDAPGRHDALASRTGRAAGNILRSTVGLALVCLVALLLLTVSSVTLAGSPAPNVTQLGPPTNAIAPYFPAGAFHRIGTYLRAGGRPEVLFMGTLADYSSAAERWPLVKALAQFGSFSRVKPAAQSCSHDVLSRPTATGISPEPPPFGREPCGPPTFGLLHGRYRSRYVAFAEKDLLDQDDHVYVKRLSPLERTLYSRYARVTAYSTETANIWGSVVGSMQTTTHRLPLLLIGDELQTGVQNAVSGDYAITFPYSRPLEVSVPFLSFDTARSALLHNAMPASTNGLVYASTLLSDVNEDANMMTAVICRVDGMQPKRVCDRPVVRRILRSLR